MFHVFLLALAATVFFSACARAPVDSFLAAIRSRNVLRVGINPGMPGLCFEAADGGYDGMEVALARLLATAIAVPSRRVEFVPVDAQTRSILLDSGEVDLVIANFTITDERKQRFHFSTAYYADLVGFMVKKNSGIKKLSDIKGRTVGVVQYSTTINSIKDALPDLNINIAQFANFSDIKAALDAGTVDVFSIDKPILRGFLDDTVEIIPPAIDIQYYGVACRLSHVELAKTVDAHIEKWLADGTIAGLIEQYKL